MEGSRKIYNRVRKIIILLTLEVFLFSQPAYRLTLSNSGGGDFTQSQWSGNHGFTPLDSPHLTG